MTAVLDHHAGHLARAARRSAQDEWREMAEAQYQAAETYTRGHMLSKRGIEAGIDPWRLWSGTQATADAYASYELKEFWADWPRITISQYQRMEREQERAYRDELDRDDRSAVRQEQGAGPQGSQGDRDRAVNVVPVAAARRPPPAERQRDRVLAGRRAAVRPAMSAARARLAERANLIRAGGDPYPDEGVSVPLSAPAEVAVPEPAAAAATRRAVVDGAETLNFARMFLARFAVWPSEAALDAVTLWDMHAHARDADGMLVTQTSPRLLWQSGEPGAGKSHTMTLAARLCPRPQILVEPSEAAVAHLIGKEHATLFFDEADVFFGRGTRKAAVRALFNTGYTREGTWPRVRSGSVEHIPTFGPLAMAGLEKMETGTDGNLAALFTRCIRIRMRRAPDGYRSPRWDREAAFVATKISERMGAWAAQNLDQIATYVPEVPEGIGNRQAQLWEPLLIVADLAGGRWPEAARQACEELTVTGDMAAEDDRDAAELDRILAGWGDES